MDTVDKKWIQWLLANVEDPDDDFEGDDENLTSGVDLG